MTQKSESIGNLTSAVLKVMEAVKGIDKSTTVGTGNNSYKGVADKDVKKIVGEAMAKNGLMIVPTGIEESTQISEWDETGQYGTKHKQSVFVKVKTTYILAHSSGEWMQLVGFGHGVDSQDKGAGKATTYALKYALLYTFLVPTGTIDDADAVHSEELPVRQTQKATTPPAQTPAVTDKELEEACMEIAIAPTLEELAKVWTKHKKFQATDKFKAIKDKRKATLTPQTA